MFVITRNGTPVARLTPATPPDGAGELTPIQVAALTRTRARMARGRPIGVGPLDRDALHER